MSAPMVSALQITPVIAAMSELGIDTTRVLAHAGLRSEELASDARISADAERLVWEAAVTLADATIGLRIAERIMPGALGSFEYLLRHSETIAEMLERAQRYGRLVDDLGEIRVRCTDGVAHIRIGRVGDYPVPAAGTECLFAVALAVARATWPGMEPIAVHFSHAAGGEPALYRTRLGCPVRFGCAANEILCHEGALHVRARNADSTLRKVLEDHTSHLLSQLPATQSFSESARNKLRQLGRFEPEPLARALGVSERTLRRKLASEGTSYQALTDELRKSIAIARVVSASTSLEALAADLGFADASTFYRAFKRWTGTTPAQYRTRSTKSV